MDAHFRAILVFALATPCWAASHRTTNFIVTAPTKSLAAEIANSAEKFRRDLAIEWIGDELPRWERPCPISANVNPSLGAGGATSFMFRNYRPFGWTMQVQGSRQRILDSVLPHEVTHTIFATHFGQPLPRWADEGACTTVEHHAERRKQEQWLIRFLQENRGIPFNHMFRMTEYPADIMPLYAQGYSVARFLIMQGGKRKFVDFVGSGLKTKDWNAALRQHYGFRRAGDLQVAWEKWLDQGRPNLVPENNDSNILLASASTGARTKQTWRPGSTKQPSSRLLAQSEPSNVNRAVRGSRPVIQGQAKPDDSYYASIAMSDQSRQPRPSNVTNLKFEKPDPPRIYVPNDKVGPILSDAGWQQHQESGGRYLR